MANLKLFSFYITKPSNSCKTRNLRTFNITRTNTLLLTCEGSRCRSAVSWYTSCAHPAASSAPIEFPLAAVRSVKELREVEFEGWWRQNWEALPVDALAVSWKKVKTS